MAYTTINKGSSYFNTVLYTGDTNSTQAVTGVGFSPDWVWIKNRTDGHWHNISDVVRGTGATKVLRSNTNAPQGGTSGHLNSFDSDGFTVAEGSSDAEEVNTNNDNYVAWNWLADSASASNSSGTLTSTVVLLSSGHVTFTSIDSPTDFARTFKNKYSISKVASFSTLIPFVKIHFVKTSLTALAICFVSWDSIAIIKTFSSLTKKGLYLILRLEEGSVNS